MATIVVTVDDRALAVWEARKLDVALVLADYVSEHATLLTTQQRDEARREVSDLFGKLATKDQQEILDLIKAKPPMSATDRAAEAFVAAEG